MTCENIIWWLKSISLSV